MSTQSVIQESAAVALPAHLLPPLESGDELPRDEFERRYEAMPHLKKAELIEGVVYMATAVRFDFHSAPHADLMGLMTLYRAATPGVRAGDNASVRLDIDNEPQPDAMLIIDPKHGGQVKISDDNYIEGAPELVAEIAASSSSIDLNRKMQAYRRNGVCEYIVWRVLDETIDWFELRDGEFQPIAPDDNGIMKSRRFPGLWLDTGALCRSDLATAVAVLQQGTSSKEHAAFVEQLQSAAG